MKDGAGDELDRRDIGQRNLHDAAAVRVRRADRDAPDRVEAVAILRRQADDDREVAVAAVLVEIARGLAADRRLHGRVDVARAAARSARRWRGRCRCARSAGRAS